MCTLLCLSPYIFVWVVLESSFDKDCLFALVFSKENVNYLLTFSVVCFYISYSLLLFPLLVSWHVYSLLLCLKKIWFPLAISKLYQANMVCTPSFVKYEAATQFYFSPLLNILIRYSEILCCGCLFWQTILGCGTYHIL